jgi:hypothetical protein
VAERNYMTKYKINVGYVIEELGDHSRKNNSFQKFRDMPFNKITAEFTSKGRYDQRLF